MIDPSTLTVEEVYAMYHWLDEPYEYCAICGEDWPEYAGEWLNGDTWICPVCVAKKGQANG